MQTTGPIAQIRHAVRSPGAALLGATLGGIIPVAVYDLAHAREVVGWTDLPIFRSLGTPSMVLVLGGLLFSAKTVYQWATAAFADRAKAAGFVVMLEGTLLFSTNSVLAHVMLGYLVAINAIATACLLARRDQSERIEVVSVQQVESETAVETVPELPATVPSAPVLAAPEETADPSVVIRLPTDRQTGDHLADAELYSRALAHLETVDAISISAMRKACNIGYDKAVSLLARLEADGVIGPEGPGKRRPVLPTAVTAAE